MKVFTITSDNNLTAYRSKADAEHADGEAVFTSVEDLAKFAASQPGARLVEIWNSIPGLTPVKKFTNRDIAVSRIWRAIQSLNSGEPATESKAGKAKAAKPAPPAKKEAKKREDGAPREGSKKAIIIGLISRKNGATLQELMEAAG